MQMGLSIRAQIKLLSQDFKKKTMRKRAIQGEANDIQRPERTNRLQYLIIRTKGALDIFISQV